MPNTPDTPPRKFPLIALVILGVLLGAAGAISWVVGATQWAQDNIPAGYLSDPALDADRGAIYWGIALVIGGAVLLAIALIIAATRSRR